MAAVCVTGQGDAPVEDWHPDCGRDTTPYDLAAINRRLSGVADHAPVPPPYVPAGPRTDA